MKTIMFLLLAALSIQVYANDLSSPAISYGARPFYLIDGKNLTHKTLPLGNTSPKN